MKLLFTFLVLSALSTLTGCVIAVNTDDWNDGEGWHARQSQNARKIEALELGKTEASIRVDFGEPDFSESFIREGQSYLVLYYRSRHVTHDGMTTKDETTPLVFVAGHLVGWGDSAVAYAVQ